jgi:23S rRNA pseudoU1915 N3-methylase RlmH
VKLVVLKVGEKSPAWADSAVEEYARRLRRAPGIDEISVRPEPFKGDVEEFTKEPHVPERRSILRGFKKFFAKKDFDDILGVRYRPALNAAGEG